MTWAEPIIRLASFASVLIVMLALETAFPKRPLGNPRRRRWPANFGIVALNTLLVRLIAPLGAVGAAQWAAARGWGLFNMFEAPGWLAIVGCFVLLDLAVWAQHLAFHKLTPLWRVHAVHHADTDIDTSTGLRFHPVEIMMSLGIKAGIVIALGAPALAVILFEVVLNATSMWNHANLSLPARLDAVLRRVLVTPDMHRVHHSWRPEETNSNYGFNFPWWDRLFGTYRVEPVDGHAAMTIGLPRFRAAAERRLDRMLTQPFR
jgi:sterol desaturase/sphingolipid hydroxylase (fatty acid hydroxylase superfamily)